MVYISSNFIPGVSLGIIMECPPVKVKSSSTPRMDRSIFNEEKKSSNDSSVIDWVRCEGAVSL